MVKVNSEYLNYLYDAMSAIKTREECKKFFDDLLTFQELESLAQRLQVARLLKEGKSYVDINGETGASTATICRVSRCLNYGDGGYKTILDKLNGGENEN